MENSKNLLPIQPTEVYKTPWFVYSVSSLYSQDSNFFSGHVILREKIWCGFSLGGGVCVIFSKI